MADQFRAVASSADAGHNETGMIYAAVITVTLLATVAVILRFMARRKSDASISYEYVKYFPALYFLFPLNLIFSPLNQAILTANMSSVTTPLCSHWWINPSHAPYIWLNFLIASSALSLWSQHKYNRYCGAMGNGKTPRHLVRKPTSPLSKSEYRLVPLHQVFIMLIPVISSLVRPRQLRPILYHMRNSQNLATPALLPSLLPLSSFPNSRLRHRRHSTRLVDRRPVR